ncbi:MAG: trimeric intracellular cation channel family protein [Oscillospiraceae bacterium]|jgi:predicted membrane protein|nr:trimeric intracellular cation channel family protein [Oscillospiraceae bacterium]
METFQFYFELIGAAAFAISGAALGIRKEMDLFGVAMLGMTTAVGGGMLRDTMLGLTPPAALRDPVQALVAIAVSILVFFVWRRRKAELHNRYAETVLLLADSLGLGIFSAHGAAIAIQAGYGANWFLVLFMGMLTGVGGGVLRDVCSAERPYIFTKHVYACASLAGAAVCLLLWPLGAGAAMMTGCGVTLALRICAAAFRWSLPKA